MKLFLGNGDTYSLGLYAVYKHIVDDVYHVVDGSLDFRTILSRVDILTMTDEALDLYSLFEVVCLSKDLIAVRKMF